MVILDGIHNSVNIVSCKSDYAKLISDYLVAESSEALRIFQRFLKKWFSQIDHIDKCS